MDSAVDRAADELRRALFAGEFAPGAPLREVPLSESMGVARSTIREALGVLVADGMAVRVTHKGVAVKQLGADDVRDVIRARIVLETAGIRSWPRAADNTRAQLRGALTDYVAVASTTANAGLVTAAHLKIHRGLVALTGSSRLIATFDSLAAEMRLALAHLDRARGNLADQIAEHTLLVELLEDGTVDAAEAELRRHLTAAESSLLAETGHGTIAS